jgi:hypothetical protein
MLEHATTLGRKVLARWHRLSRHEQSECAAGLVAHDDGTPTVATDPTQHESFEKALLTAFSAAVRHGALWCSGQYGALNLCACGCAAAHVPQAKSVRGFALCACACCVV